MTMAAATSLETLLRATELTVGSIWLSRDNGSPSWRAVITHGHSERDHPRRDADAFYAFGAYCGDPADALMSALVENERQGRDLARRYAAADKLGPVLPGSGHDLALDKHAGIDPDFDALDDLDDVLG